MAGNCLGDNVAERILGQVEDYSCLIVEQLKPLDDLSLGQYREFAHALAEEQYRDLLRNKNLPGNVRQKLCEFRTPPGAKRPEVPPEVFGLHPAMEDVGAYSKF